MARPRRFERPTFAFGGQRSIQLSYGRLTPQIDETRPFRQLATSPRWGASGTGLGLPITKALAEANHARFRITSHVQDGTLVEVAFPATRVLAQ